MLTTQEEGTLRSSGLINSSNMPANAFIIFVVALTEGVFEFHQAFSLARACMKSLFVVFMPSD